MKRITKKTSYQRDAERFLALQRKEHITDEAMKAIEQALEARR